MDAVIASYYTPLYRQVAQRRLLKSLRALDVPVQIRAHPQEFPTWQKACAYKAEYLLETYKQNPNRAVLWVDVDAEVHTDPLPFLKTLHGDVAVHYRRQRTLLSGTIWLRGDSDIVKPLLQRWIRLNRKQPGRLDQRNLQRAIRTVSGVTVTDLPPEYCFIYDKMRRSYPDIAPVIEHFQASRRLRRRKRTAQ